MSYPFAPQKVASQTEALYQHAKAKYEIVESHKANKPRSLRCARFALGNMREAILDLETHLLGAYDLDVYKNDGHFEDRDIAISGIAVRAKFVLHRSPSEQANNSNLRMRSANHVPLLFTGVTILDDFSGIGSHLVEQKGIFMAGVDVSQAFESYEPAPHIYVPFEGLQIIATAQQTLPS